MSRARSLAARYLSAETALRDYGVVVTDRTELDHEATVQTRRARRG